MSNGLYNDADICFSFIFKIWFAWKWGLDYSQNWAAMYSEC